MAASASTSAVPWRPRRRPWGPFGALLGLVLTTPAPAATPCAGADLPAPVASLAQRLEATRDRGGLARLAQDAAALTATGTADARACAAYTAGSAWFFLSATGADRRFHATRAVQHFLLAQVLDAVGMGSVQPTSRLRAAWDRVGAVPGWLDDGGPPVATTLPAGAGEVRLAPADESAWKAACGATATCDAAAAVWLPLHPTLPRTLSLRAGHYGVRLRTACGETEQAVMVAGGPLVLPPAAACPVTLLVRDGANNISDFKVLDTKGSPVVGPLTAALGGLTVQAPGYHAVHLSLPAEGGELPVPLQRCDVDLVVITPLPPTEVQIVGAGRAPWGPRSVRLGRPYDPPITVEVEVPPTEPCGQGRHEVSLMLEPPIEVQALDPSGAPTRLSHLWVNQRPVSTEGFLIRAGHHEYEAEHPELGTLRGRFVLEACATGSCAPQPLVIPFSKPHDAHIGPWLLAVGGGTSAIAGVVFGAAALDLDGQIQHYTVRREESRSLGALVADRDHQATLANVSFGVGATLAVSALIWYLAGSD